MNLLIFSYISTFTYSNEIKIRLNRILSVLKSDICIPSASKFTQVISAAY